MFVVFSSPMDSDAPCGVTVTRVGCCLVFGGCSIHRSRHLICVERTPMNWSEERIATCLFLGVFIGLFAAMLFAFGMWCCNEGNIRLSFGFWLAAGVLGFVSGGLILPAQAKNYGTD